MKLLKEQNKFLFEESPEEKKMAERIKTFTYVDESDEDISLKTK